MSKNPTITFDRLQTLGAQSFDLETISVTVARLVETNQLRLIIQDELAGNCEELRFNLDATEAQVMRLLMLTADVMKLKRDQPNTEIV